MELVSNSLVSIKPFSPVEFSRRPRELKRTWNRLKGTELRRLLLYDGLKVFNHLDKNLFNNFLLLHSAIHILSSENLRDFLDIADAIIQEFVSHSARVFGRQFVVYNVHSLRHIVQECEEHGTVQEFDAFRYENYLGVLKRLLRSGYKSLQQVYNRDSERNGHLCRPKEHVDENNALLSQAHVREGGELLHGLQYQKIELRDVTLALNQRDRCFVTPDSDIILLSNIVQEDNGNIALIGRKFMHKENVYEIPIPSSHLGIWKVSALEDTRHAWDFAAFSRKCYLIPDADCFIAVPLIHFIQH
ncbi:UPF0210 protein [Frankliniella fusca]|uniref:UPF0210 protein n=1 Tax=Frankliniella fusca TaxID=407009 RepID=A0AAE1HMS7_9NEOP|nr:UPF0210 protein [Frankliniella fusca]KAK3924132.1 UPF0210 protein [Frankliniella fusca]